MALYCVSFLCNMVRIEDYWVWREAAEADKWPTA